VIVLMQLGLIAHACYQIAVDMSVEPLELVPEVLSLAGPAAVGSPHGEVSSAETGGVNNDFGTGVGVARGGKAGMGIGDEVSGMAG
jgi:hypothetical protein